MSFTGRMFYVRNEWSEDVAAQPKEIGESQMEQSTGRPSLLKLSSPDFAGVLHEVGRWKMCLLQR